MQQQGQGQGDYFPVAYYSPSPDGQVTTPFKVEPAGPTTPPPIAVREGSTRTTLLILTTTAAIFLAIIVPLSLLTYYLLGYNEYVLNGWRLATTGTSGVILGLSQLCGKVCALAVIPALSIHAWATATAWMGARKSSERPTASQLGSVMSVISGGTPVALFRTWHFTKAQRREGATAWLLALEYAIYGMDQALHFTIKADRVAIANTVTDASLSMAGRQLNNSFCQEWAKTYPSLSETRESCGLDRGPVAASIYGYMPQGLRVLTNTSSLHNVAWLEDNTAILTETGGGNNNASYIASTLGISSNCQSITRECIPFCKYANSNEEYACPGSGSSQSTLNFTCNGPHRYDATDHFDHTANILDSDGNRLSYVNTTNPFQYGAVAWSNVFAQEEGWAGDTGFYRWGSLKAANVLYCNISVHSVQYQFTPPASYRMLRKSLADPKTSKIFAQGAQTAPQDYVTYALEGVGTEDDPTPYAAAFARQLSKTALAMVSLTVEPIPTDQNVGTIKPAVVIHLAILAGYYAAVLIFGMSILAIGLHAAYQKATCKDPSLRPAREWLLSPFPLLSQFYGKPSGETVLSTDPGKLFGNETEADRLHIGPRWNGYAWRMAVSKQL